uniref:DDE Tnp4 domain-containing protein n=2 Tax=Pectinophora gossypiella TaxID=13191 RepID=A0A1E1VYI0_PECGO
MITGSSARTLSSSFRLGESTIRSIIQEVCNAIINKLMGIFIPTPIEERWKSIAEGFQDRWNFPNCIGAIDGKHVNIIAPANSGSLYFNYKKHFSVVLMAVVDDKYRFIIVDIGAFGRNSDGGIFASSKLARRLESNSLHIPNDKPLPGSNRDIPHVFIGDEAFPLMKNLMRPYPRCRGLSEAQTTFNERLSRARKVVEDAFGILYQKFGIYNKSINMNPIHVDTLILATCILHNIMRSYEIEYLNQHEMQQPIHRNENGFLQPILLENGMNSAENAFNIRDLFSSYFQSPEGQVPWLHQNI